MEGHDDLDYLSSWGLSRLISVQMALRAAIELDVFNNIANSGPKAQLSAAEIVSKIPTTNPSAAAALDRILRMLSANALLTASLRPCPNGEMRQESVYGLTDETRCLLTDKGGNSTAPMTVFLSEKEVVDSFYMLKDAVLEPGCTPFEKANGASFFDYTSKKPELSQLFNEAMATSTKVFFDKVLKTYAGFEEVKELLDVGGGFGTSIKKIVSTYPHIHGVNFDLPHVISDAPKYPDVEHVAGNMFESVPNAQAILLKRILHDWDDDRCMKLLRNCCKALPDNGKVIVVEFVIPEELGNNADSLNSTASDYLMMVWLPGAKERTMAEFDDLAKIAGFAETKFFPIGQGIYVMEFYKRATR
ncbi:hypothetical protein L1049_009938 [Liquidambar formosana]|uniref:Uncharacterized protein n=1 Tax=Liquidambar formosana TaxID=63359 RepID=A0AAP0R3W1_LIQFO